MFDSTRNSSLESGYSEWIIPANDHLNHRLSNRLESLSAGSSRLESPGVAWSRSESLQVPLSPSESLLKRRPFGEESFRDSSFKPNYHYD